MKTRLIAIAGLALVAAGIFASQALAVMTVSQSGSPGYWDSYIAKTVCDGGIPYLASPAIKPIEPVITPSPRYPNHVQTVRMFSRIESWNGSSWAYYTQDPVWNTQKTSPGQRLILFSTKHLNVAKGRHYRVVQFYEWWVNGVRVGTVTNRFHQSEYLGLGATPGSTNEGGYCTIH